MNYEQFTEKVVPVIIEKAKEKGYAFPSAIIAQAICESGVLRGGSILSNSHFNYFGMKKGTSYKGATVKLKTKEEYKQGVLTTIYAEFRSFPDIASGVEGYFEFLKLKRYANLKDATSPEDYIEKLKQDGWATSSTYINTLKKLLNDYGLKKYDNASNIIKINEQKQADKDTIKKNTENMQKILNNYGYNLAVDGILGVKTFNALQDFRKK